MQIAKGRLTAKTLIVVLVLGFSSLAVQSGQVSASSRPSGSAALATKSLRKIGAVQCGLLNKTWTAGTLYSKKWFISFLKQSTVARSDAKKTKGDKRKAMLRQSSKLASKAKSQQKVCDRVNNVSKSNSIKFDFTNVSSLRLTRPAVSTSSVHKYSTKSNVEAVLIDGTTRDAVSSGYVAVEMIFFAPNDKLYMQFSTANRYDPDSRTYVQYQLDGAPCRLAEVSRVTGIPKCIERDVHLRLTTRGQSSYCNSGSTICAPPSIYPPLFNGVQFDSSGAIYYMGRPDNLGLESGPDVLPNCRGAFTLFLTGNSNMPLTPGKVANCEIDTTSVGTILRRYKDGVSTDIAKATIEPVSFRRDGRPKYEGINGNLCQPYKFVVGTVKETGETVDCDSFPDTYIMTRNGINDFLVFDDGSVLVDQRVSNVGDGIACFFNTDGSRSVGADSCNFHRLDLYGPDLVRSTIATDTSWDRFAFMIRADAQQAYIATPEVESGKLVSYLHKVNIANKSFLDLPFSLGKNFSDHPQCVSSRGEGLTEFNQYFCNQNSGWRELWVNSQGKLFGVKGVESYCFSQCSVWQNTGLGLKVTLGHGVLVGLQPDIELTPLGSSAPDSAIVGIHTFLRIGDLLFASGLDSAGKNRTIIYDTKSAVTSELIPASTNIRIDQMAYEAKTNSLLFGGTRMSDNTVVIGSVKLDSKVVTILKSGTDIQSSDQTYNYTDGTFSFDL